MKTQEITNTEIVFVDCSDDEAIMLLKTAKSSDSSAYYPNPLMVIGKNVTATAKKMVGESTYTVSIKHTYMKKEGLEEIYNVYINFSET